MKSRTRSIGVLVGIAIAWGCSEGGDRAARGASPSPNSDSGDCPVPFAECDGNPGTLCETRLDNDVSSCGACGKTCPVGAPHQVAECRASACIFVCEKGFVDCDRVPANGCEEPAETCGVTTLVATLANPWGLAVDETSIYYGTKGTAPDFPDGILYKAPKGGGEPVVLATGLNRPLNITLDDTRVYWTNGGHTDRPDGSLDSIAKTGGDRVTLATAMIRPGNPVLSGDRIFWTVRDQGAGRILMARKDGTDPAPTELVTGVPNPSDLQLAGTTLVWATAGTDSFGKNAAVERANLDGTGRMPLASGITSPSYQLGITPDAVFVGSAADGSVRRIPFDLGGPKTLATALGTIQEVIVNGSMVFFTTGSGGRVLGIPTGGGDPVVIADAQTFPSYIARDADHLYWTDGPLAGAATVRRARMPGR